MAINNRARAFRLSRASELEQFGRVLNKAGICDTSKIFEAANQIKNFDYVPKIELSDPINYDFWGYDTGDINFYFEQLPRHTHPENATNLCLSLSVRLIADYQEFKVVCDPYRYLEFNIVISGNYVNGNTGKSSELITSYHLDRHIFKDGDNTPEDCHPIYHLQFGGRKLEKKFRDFGNSLILDAPRVVHYPMDIILGVDFVLSNFFSTSWRKLRQDGEYVNLVRDYQSYIWKPYAHTKASHWKPFAQQDIFWNPAAIWPQLLTGI
ncbi:hypothetical protein [Algoriphagus terrigena]|uniref:hypothetical protein n=1 Tax=Algoriphagus terrigena TaxID=344884 RepID=UPI0004120753|nr:hypothetical protein [Algoriphagus terrigena]